MGTEPLVGWSEFNVALAGAGAALAGLIIVAMSVNIDAILKTDTLPSRAAASIGTLVLAVAGACLALMPAQPMWLLGLEIVIGAAAVWLIELRAGYRIVRSGDPTGLRLLKVVIGALPLAVITAGAAMLLLGQADGAYPVAIGGVLAVVGAVLFSWIALVEILR